MTVSLFKISQAGRMIAVLEASDRDAAIHRAKGLQSAVDLRADLPFDAASIPEAPAGVPIFRDDYFLLVSVRPLPS